MKIRLTIFFAFWTSALFGQSFTATGAMLTARLQHTATLLNNGNVLVAGGFGINGQPTNSAEIYNAQTGTWRYTGIGQQTTMTTPRYLHIATKLADGRVLLAGGYVSLQPNGAGGGVTPISTDSAEIFDPATETFTLTGYLNGTHTGAQALLLNDGRVLVVGGLDSGSPSGAVPSEIYDPSLGTWNAGVPALPTGDSGPAVALLADGDVFVAGGINACCTVFSTAALYTPASNTLRTMANLLTVRASGATTALPNGQILIVGGYDNSFTLTSTELYDPAASPNGQSQYGYSLNQSRRDHTATLLSSGDVLVAGGQQGAPGTQNTYLSTGELRDHITGLWSLAGTMSTARVGHTATLLPSGSVLVAGGGPGAPTNSADLWAGSVTPPTFTETFNNAPNYSNNWVVAGQAGTFNVTYTPGNFRIQAPAVCTNGNGGTGITYRSIQAFVGDLDVSFQLDHGGYGRTTVGLSSVNTNQPVIESILDTDDTAYLDFASGSNDSGYTYSSAPYMNKWITLRIQVVGNVVNFYADNGSGPQLLKTWPVPIASPPDAYYIYFGAASVCWKSGPNDTSFRSITATGTPATGTINVTTNLQGATFTITGPATYTGGGTAFTQTNAPVGTYTITYGAVSQYSTPPPQTLNLAAAESISFLGTYSPIVLSASPPSLSFSYQQGPTGTIPTKAVNVASGLTPAAMTTSVSTTPPGGTWLSISSSSSTTPGSVNIAVSSALAAGVYTGALQITAPDAANSPIVVPISLTVGPPAVTTGTVTVQSSPASAYFQVSGPGLTYLSGNTPFQQSGLPAGSYTITWGILLGGYQTPATQAQILAPGGSVAFSGTYLKPGSSSFTLAFPLAGKDAYSAGINTVFDHSMARSDGKYTLYATNGMDGIVTDFANETGTTKTPMSQGCYPQPNSLMFFANTAYTPPYGTLCYENHPGIDYHVDGNQTQILAAASGQVVYPSKMIGLADPSQFHVLAIKPAKPTVGDYVIFYLHLDTYTDSPTEQIANAPAGCPTSLPIPAGTAISPGCVIGRAGGWGPASIIKPPCTTVVGNASPCAFQVHLHFEVHKIVSSDQVPTNTCYPASSFLCPPEVDPSRTLSCVPVDPYGWDGPVGTDPYQILTKGTTGTGIENVRLWDHLLLTYSSSPDITQSGSKQISLSGDGFVPESIVVAVDGSTLKTIVTTSSISSLSTATVTGTWSSGKTYYLYVVTPDGRHSNWQKLTVSPASGGNR